MESKIQILPDYLIDQIKAGEVIENAAFLLKEIIENSIDAGATEIELLIINNGLDLIRIKDNGNGMSFKELPYAFKQHATSKLSNLKDLYSMKSYGFRGEALASMASIAKIDCISSPIENIPAGGQIIIKDGQIKNHTNNYNSYNGTIITITDLFYNTPVRLKFLKSKNSQKKEIIKILNAFILSNPNVKFSFKFDNKNRSIYPSCENLLTRVNLLFSKKHNLIKNFSLEYHPFNLNCILMDFNTAKSYRYLFINGRLVYDFGLMAIINQFFEDNFNQKFGGGFILDIKIPIEKVDINIHPNKTTVNYPDKNILYSLIKNALKKEYNQKILERQTSIKEYNLDDSLYNNSLDTMNRFSEFIDNQYLILKMPFQFERVKLQNKINDNDLAQINNYPILLNLERIYNEFINKIMTKMQDEEEIPLQVIIPIDSKLFYQNRSEKEYLISHLDKYKIGVQSIGEDLYVSSIPNTLSYFNLTNFLPIFFRIIQQKEVPHLSYSQFFSKTILSSLLVTNYQQWLKNKNALVLNYENIKELF